MLQVKGAGWMGFTDEAVNEAKEAGFEIPQKIQGERKLMAYLEENPDLVEYFEKKFRKLI